MKKENTDFTKNFNSETGEAYTENWNKYLTFWLDKQLFAIPVESIIQIIGVQEITPIPEFPYYAKGIINLRGMIIPVVDARVRFGKEEITYDDRTCIVVVEINGVNVGYIVDEVDQVLDIPHNQIALPPKFSQSAMIDCLTGIAKLQNQVALVIDMSRVIPVEELNLDQEIETES